MKLKQDNINQNITFASQIRFKIGTRILLCFMISILMIMFLSYRDLLIKLNLLDQQVISLCNELEEYIVSQVLLGNEKSIDAKLIELQKINSFKIAWVKNISNQFRSGVRMQFPFKWEFNYNIRSLDNRNFGHVIIQGSLLEDKSLISELITRLILVLSFFLGLFALLIPLAKKIPKEIFLNPILDILSLLKDPDLYVSQYSLQSSNEMIEIKNKIIQLVELTKRESHDAAIGKLSAQLAHDIRSPLAVLNILMNDTSSISDDKIELIKKSIRRIQDIANNLLSEYKLNSIQTLNNSNSYINTSLSTIITEIVCEKKCQFPGFNIDFHVCENESEGDFYVKIPSAELYRIFSNLINNSIEASENNGFIHLALFKELDYAIVTITDYGCGIPDFVLEKLFQEKVTYGKIDGCGLGIKHAFTVLKEHAGDLFISSQLNKGTIVKIKLPLKSHDANCLQREIIAKNSASTAVS